MYKLGLFHLSHLLLASVFSTALVLRADLLDRWHLRFTTDRVKPDMISQTSGRVFVSSVSGIISSSDGLQWQSHSLEIRDIPNLGIYSFAAGKGQFVAYSLEFILPGTVRPFIATSTDLSAWTVQRQQKGFLHLSFVNDSFFALGNSIAISSDAQTWVDVSPSGIPTNAAEVLGALAYGNGVYVAVGYGGLVYTSVDGRNWIRQAQSGLGPRAESFGPRGAIAAAYGAGRFIAVNGTNIITSTDGKSWARVPLREPASLVNITHLHGFFIACGSKLLISRDGLQWNTVEFPSRPNRFLAAGAWRNTVLVATDETKIYQSDPMPDLKPEAPVFSVNRRFITESKISLAGAAVVEIQSGRAQANTFYTTDGTPPGFRSPLFTNAFEITNSVLLRAVAYDADFQNPVESQSLYLELLPEYSVQFATIGLGTVTPASGLYASNTFLRVEATPSPGWRFERWSGTIESTNPVLNLTVNQAISLTASFAQIPMHPLKVISTGGGAVSVLPTGTNFIEGSAIQLTARPLEGWTFLRWTGAIASTNPAVTLLMDNAKTVQAEFATTLSISIVGPGTVRTDPPGPLYPHGQPVRLTALPSPESIFVAWGNALQSTANPVDFNVTAPGRTISALFISSNAYALNVSLEGNGTIAIEPPQRFFNHGDRVTLRARPGPKYFFTGWAGSIQATNQEITLNMSSDQTVRALFSGWDVTNGFRWFIPGTPAEKFSIATSSNAVNWTFSTTITNVNGHSLYQDKAATNTSRRFYRALKF